MLVDDWGYESFHSDMKVRKHFAWVSDMNYIKWNNLTIINPAKYQGIVICNNKIYMYRVVHIVPVYFEQLV